MRERCGAWHTAECAAVPRLQDFAAVLARPKLVALGAALQYTVMPLMGLAVSRGAGLSAPLAVGCTPAGAAHLDEIVLMTPS